MPKCTKRQDRFRALRPARDRSRLQRRRPEQRWGAAAVAPGRSAPGLEPRGGCGDPRPARPRAHPPLLARPVGTAPLRPVLRLRGPERPQRAARRCADADGRRARRGAGLGAHLQPPGEPGHARAGVGAARGADRAVHRQPQERARGTGARHRRLGRAAARRNRSCASSTPTTTTTATCRCTCSAARRCWRATAAQQDRRRQARRGADQAAGARGCARPGPNTRIIVRGDSGFCRRRLLQWCERSGVGYVIGLARNARLHAAVELAEAASGRAYARQRQPSSG